MFFLLSPIVSMMMKAGAFKAVSAIKDHLICWLIVVIASIFALLFLNIAIYLLVSLKLGALYAAMTLCSLWLFIGFFAIMWANSSYKKSKTHNSQHIADMAYNQRDVWLPVALTILPILKRRKKIIATLSAIILGAAATVNKVRSRHRY